jgi:tetratricopeptide (TPR) repeat protein
MKTHNSSHEISSGIESLTHGTDLSLIEEELIELLNVVQLKTGKLLTKPIRSQRDFVERLATAKKAYKQGRFDKPLAIATKNLSTYLRSLGVQEQPEYYKARTLLYELNDILSVDSQISDYTFEDGQRAYTQLQAQSDKWSAKGELSEPDLRLIKEKVLFCSCYGHGLKRRNLPNQAAETFQWLLDFTANKIATTRQMPAYGTRANLSYNLGSVYRVLEQHGKSEAMYAQALRFYHDRTKTRPANDFDDLYFITRRIAMCVGLGFGWLHLTRGNLNRAENALLTARAFLAKSPDHIVSSFIELLYGSMRRCKAGHDQTEAINSLNQARKAFEHNHPRYHAYACLELALSFTLKADFEAALAHLEAAEQYAQQQQNEPKWLTNIHIGRSRIRRHQRDYERALTEAEMAIDMAEHGKTILPRADAYLAHGEARLYLAKEPGGPSTPTYGEARKDFEKALELVLEEESSHRGNEKTLNPKIASVCVLRIAQCYAKDGNQIKAKSFFQRWKTWEPTVEHQWVRDLAKEVEGDINELEDFFSISSRDPKEWNYERQLSRLRKWLYTQAMSYTNNDRKAAAKLIGLSPTSVFNLPYPVKRGRAKRTK